MADELLTELVPSVYRFALRLTCDGHAAEDLVQETFLRAWKRRHRLLEPRAALAWMLRIAVNVHRDQLRRGGAKRTSPAGDSEPAEPAAPPEARLSAGEEVLWVLRHLDALPARQRQVLYLSAIEGFAHERIAEILGISSGAVKVSLSLARRTMRERLAAAR